MLREGTALLLEREGELAELDRLADDARGGRGRMVLVEGPPGIGKTSLLAVLRARSREHEMLVLAARASELDREFPFGLVRQLFEPLLSRAEPARRHELLRGAAAGAESLLRGGAVAGVRREEDADPSFAHFHAFYWLVANLADEHPLALVLDDVQWADASSLRFLEFLAPRLDELPVLIAVAARTSEPGSELRDIDPLATDPQSVVLSPAPLGGDAVSALVVAELGDAPSPDFLAACREVTGGNPFLLRELLRELAADGITPDSTGVGVVRQVAPPTVARAVVLRLARLGGAASSVARAVAVLGDSVPLHRVLALAGSIDQGEGERAAAALAEAGILADSRPLEFAHPILLAAVYADIDAAERDHLHRRAARLLADEGAEADAIAVHLLNTEPAEDARIAKTLREAARRALARGAAEVAVACLRRAVSEPPPAGERGPTLLELASAEFRAGDPGAAASDFEEGMRAAADPRTRAGHAAEWGYALQAAGRYEQALAVRERAIEDVAGVDRDLALSLEAGVIASAGLDMSRRAWAGERLGRYRGRLSGQTPGEAELLALQAAADAVDPERRDSADELADRAAGPLAVLVDGGRISSTPFFSAIELLMLADRAEPVRRILDRGIEDARRHGSAPAFAFLSGWRCLLLARSGQLVEAEADARSSMSLALPQGWFGVAPVMLGYILEALVDRGELDDAEDLLERSGFGERGPDDDLTLDPVVHARARIRVARGDVAGARADLGALARRPARWNTYPALVPPVLVAPELASGDPDEDREAADRLMKEATVWGTPRAIGMALRAAGCVEGGERGLELLEQAVAVLDESPAPLEHARALTDWGAALRRANRRSASREPLRRALDEADACGAGALADRARHELRAAGGGPRRPRASGVEALTASERRIAAMATDGLSNPEIAQALFVTKKTVEAHLGNAYRKLGINSRAQLPAAMRKSQPGARAG